MCLAIPGRIIEISVDDPVARLGKVSFGGAERTVSLACVPEATVGDYVLVHAGLALCRVDDSDAETTLNLFEPAVGSYGVSESDDEVPE